MSQVHEEPSKEMVDVSLEALCIQANDLPERAVLTHPNDNATIPRQLPNVENRAEMQRDFTDLNTSLQIANDPQGSIGEITGIGSHGQHSSGRSSTFLSLPTEIRAMILKTIFGGRKVYVRSECISSEYVPLRSKVSLSRWCEVASRRSNKFSRTAGRSIRNDIHFVHKARSGNRSSLLQAQHTEATAPISVGNF